MQALADRATSLPPPDTEQLRPLRRRLYRQLGHPPQTSVIICEGRSDTHVRNPSVNVAAMPRPVAKVRRPQALLNSELIYAEFSDHQFAPHEHTTWTIGWVVDGANDFRCERQSYCAPAGTLCVVNPAEVHTGGGKQMSYWCLMPSTELMHLAFPDTDPGALCSAPAVVDDPVALKAAYQLFTLPPMDGDLLTPQAGGVVLLRSQLGRSLRDRAEDRSCGPGAVARATEYLQDNLERQVPLAELSQISGVSAFQLCREFAARLHISPGAFIRSRRVARAQELIRAAEDLSGVAASCGFADQAHMTRLFRTVVGCTPAQWRGAI